MSGRLCSLILGTASLLACNEATLSLFPNADSLTEAGGAAPVSGTEGLVGQWSLDGDTNDAVGTNDGTLPGTASFVTDTSRGQVLQCDGQGPGFSVANLTSASFSYAFWVWTDTPSNQGGGALEGNALLWSNTADAIDDFTLSVMNNRLDYIGYNQTTAGTVNVVDGTWHHVAVTREDGGSVFLYVDGILDGAGDAGSGPVTSNPQVYVGGNPVDHRFFTGLIDDLRQYDRALDADEVRRLFTTTALP